MSLEKLKPWPTPRNWDLYGTTNHFCGTRNFIVGSFSAILALVNKSSTCAACSLKFTYFNIVPQFFSNNHRSTPAPNGASVYSTRIFPVTVCHCSSVARLRPPRNSHLHISRINRSPEFFNHRRRILPYSPILPRSYLFVYRTITPPQNMIRRPCLFFKPNWKIRNTKWSTSNDVL